MKKFPYKLLVSFLFLSFNINSLQAQMSDLSLDILLDSKTPNVRSTVKFTIIINNAGKDDATGVAIHTELGNGYDEITPTKKEGIKAGNTINWSELTVPAYSNIFLHLKARVLSSGDYNCKIEIVASDNEDPNSDPGSGFDTDDLEDKRADDDELDIDYITPIPSDFDKDNVFDIDDLDDDNDGIPDKDESYGVNPDDDFDKDGTPVYLDDNDNNFDIGDNNDTAETFFDFDNDGIPNHLDYDADNDGILDIYESGHHVPENIVKGKIISNSDDFGVDGLYNKFETAQNSGKLIYELLNTDNDENANFLDTDDDNDGILTKDENADPNNDGNPEDAVDTDKDGVPDYLDNDSNGSIAQVKKQNVLIENESDEVKTATISAKGRVYDVKLFTDKGIEVTPSIQTIGNLIQLDISNLESGTYFLQFKSANKVNIKKMIID